MSTTSHDAATRSGAAPLGAVGRVGLRAAAVATGYALLLGAIAIVLFYPNGMWPIVLATGATVLLSLDRRLGPLPAALFVALCLPVGRGAEIGLPRILGDVPLRAHDLVPMAGVVLAVPAVVRRVGRPGWIGMEIVPLAVFAAVGVLALAVGLIGDQQMRDIFRDVRWWAFYGVGLIALLAGTPASAIQRGLVWGLTIYSALILIGLLMPLFHGGLKYGAYAYDPRMRLHYGQAVLLLPAVALAVERFVRRPSLMGGSLIALLAAGISVTLTRTLLAGLIGVAVLAAAWTAVEVARRSGARARLRAAPALLAVLVGIGGGFGIYQAGVQIWVPDWAYSANPTDPGAGPTEERPVRPSLGRVFEDTENAGFSAQGAGRLTSYAIAFVDEARSPVIGHGMGALARIPWAWGGFRAYTAGAQPGVDNAYLTVGLKAGAIGIAAFAAMMLWPLRQVMGRRLRRIRPWYVPAWLGILGLTMIQSFAVSGYAPFALALLVVIPGAATAAHRAR